MQEGGEVWGVEDLTGVSSHWVRKRWEAEGNKLKVHIIIPYYLS